MKFVTLLSIGFAREDSSTCIQDSTTLQRILRLTHQGQQRSGAKSAVYDCVVASGIATGWTGVDMSPVPDFC